MNLSRRTRNFLQLVVVLAVAAYVGFGSFIWHEMRQGPEPFARVMARMPAPVVFVLFPFETMWTHARAGRLRVGDAVPDFSLMKVDKTGAVQLSALNRQQPVVLVFGSYT